MKNLGIQTVLAATMLVIVFAASQKLSVLDQIKEEARNMSMHNSTHGVSRIRWPKTNVSDGVCRHDVFCLAEKALEETDLKNSKLSNLLKSYNRSNSKVSCHLDGNHKISIHRFLDIVASCAKQKAIKSQIGRRKE